MFNEFKEVFVRKIQNKKKIFVTKDEKTAAFNGNFVILLLNVNQEITEAHVD